VKPTFSIANRMKAMRLSIAGFLSVLRSEHAMWFHAGSAALIVVAGQYFQISAIDWRWVVLAITLVWCAEAMNTAIEIVCDAMHPEHHPLIGKAKDVAAGAVFCAVLGAAVMVALVFWPYVFALQSAA
jgi:diacylglycerol kinase (ATP)